MNFEHMKCIVSISKNKTISAASRELFVSQPYLSSMLSRLEKELGFSMFLRTRKGLVLTEEGKEVLESAEIILQEYDKIQRISKKRNEHPLKCCGYYSSFLMKTFLKYRMGMGGFPGDRYLEMGNEELIRSVSEGQNDLGIIVYDSNKKEKYIQMVEKKDCICKEFYKDIPIYILCGINHPFAKEDEISLSEVEKQSIVCYDDPPSSQYLKIFHLEKKEDLLYVSNRSGLLDAICTGNYLALMTRVECKSHQEDGRSIAFVPIKECPSLLDMSVIMRRTYHMNSREKSFIYYLWSEFEKEMMS